jgi:hypothetical protein
VKTPLDVYRPAAEAGCRYRVLYGGAGSGKSVFTAMDHLVECERRPGERVLVLRKVARTLRHSTFSLFRDILATWAWSHVRLNKTEMILEWPNGSQIIHAGLDDVEKLKSIAGVTRIWIEEATELDEADLSQVDLRLRGVDESRCPQITYTFNPTQEARRIFSYVKYPTADLPSRSSKRHGDVFVQHTTYLDNPHVGSDYVKVFSRLGGAMKTVYELGEMAAVDAPDQVIPYEYVKRAIEMDSAEHDGRQRLAIDVARKGDDETVFQYFKGYELHETTAFSGQDLNRTRVLASNMIRERGIPAELVAIDAVGMGAGPADELRADGLEVTDVVSGASPVDLEWSFAGMTFKNLRSQMWFWAREQMAAGNVAIRVTNTDALMKLQEDLLAPRYRIGNEKRVEVEPKEGSRNWGIKQRLGRSTDYGDPFVYGLFVENLVQEDWLFA